MQPRQGPVPASSLEIVPGGSSWLGFQGLRVWYRDVLRVLSPPEPQHRASEGIFGLDVKETGETTDESFMGEVRYWQYCVARHGWQPMEALKQNVYPYLRRHANSSSFILTTSAGGIGYPDRRHANTRSFGINNILSGAGAGSYRRHGCNDAEVKLVPIRLKFYGTLMLGQPTAAVLVVHSACG